MIRENSFNVAVAKVYGVDKAIILWRLCLFLQKHKAEDSGQIDGRTWTSQTAKGLTSQFPYWSLQKIQRLLRSLVTDDQILMVDTQTENKWNRTMRHAFVNEEEWLTVETLHISKLTHRSVKTDASRASARVCVNTVQKEITSNTVIKASPVNDYGGDVFDEGWMSTVMQIVNHHRHARFGLDSISSTGSLPEVRTCLRKYGVEACITVAEWYFSKASDPSYMKPENGFRPTKFESKRQSALDSLNSKVKQHDIPKNQPRSTSPTQKSKDWLREQGLSL